MFARIALSLLALSVTALVNAGPAWADDAQKAAVASEKDGKYFDAEGNPTFKIQPSGVVDWYTYSGFLRFNSSCYVCHGPDGVGSSYAPALTDAMKSMDYGTFLSIVAEGRKNLGAGQESVMPAFGDNKNVYCYIDDIYVYLRARAVGNLPRGRPPEHEPKSQAAKDYENQCMGG